MNRDECIPIADEFTRQMRAYERDTFGALNFFVSMEDIEGLDSKIRHLQTDIATLIQKTSDFSKLQDVLILNGQWLTFRSGWGGWVAEHFSTLSRAGADAVQEFEQFQAEYNEFLRRVKEDFNSKTTAQPSTQKPGADTGLESTTSAVKFASVAIVALVGAYILSKAY